MKYVGVIASSVLHVGGLFLLLGARAPEPLIPLGTDTPVAVALISVDEYNALVSRAPSSSTLAALRTQPEVPSAPAPADADPVSDTLDTPPETPAPAVELAMRLPPAPDEAPPEAEETPAPEEAEVAVAPPPEPLALDTAALQDRGVDPADLGPPEDVQIAAPPPAPKPPRGAMDAMPQIDTSTDEPPEVAEAEGEGQEAAPVPEPRAEPEAPVELAEADDPAPLATPLPVRKPRGSLAVASDAEREPAPAQVAEAAPEPAPPVETPPEAQPEPEPEPEPENASQLTDAELEEERRLMAALMEQMRAEQPPTEEDLRAAEDEARRTFEEEQQRLAELAALDDEERRRREEEDRARDAAEQRARDIAAARERQAAEQQRAEQDAARREAEDERRRAAIEAQQEAQRRAQADLDRQRREAAQREQDARNLAARRQQLAALDAGPTPEARANAVLGNAAPSAPPTSSLDRIFAAANSAASSANAGSSFSQGAARAGASLTAGETQAVLDQLRRCWRVDTFSANARSLVVTFRVSLRQNGFIDQGSISLVSPNPPPPEFQVAVDRARTALQDTRCQPFSLPPQKFNAWRDIVIRFDPAQMVLQ